MKKVTVSKRKWEERTCSRSQLRMATWRDIHLRLMACKNYVQHQVLTPHTDQKEFVGFKVHEAGREKLRRGQGRATAAPELSAGRADTCLREFCRAEI